VKPIASFPFEQRFEIPNRSRVAKGTVCLRDDNVVMLQVLLSYVQEGSRPVRVECGGKTTWDLLDDHYYSGGYFPDRPHYSHWVNVHLPHGAEAETQATVTFVDAGEPVTLTVPLETLPPSGDLAARKKFSAEQEKKLLDQVAKLLPKEDANADPLARAYQELASEAQRYDHGKFKDYATRSMAYRNKLRQIELDKAKDEQNRIWAREAFLSDATWLYSAAVEWGLAGEAESEYQAALAKIQGSGLPAKSVNERAAQLQDWHATNVVRLTGDLAKAAALWKQARDLGRNMGTKCPYELDPSFRK
jgi:hypothetical protein